MATERIYTGDGEFFDVETSRGEESCPHNRLASRRVVSEHDDKVAECTECGETFTAAQAKAWIEFIKSR